jgi:hypothetical protein
LMPLQSFFKAASFSVRLKRRFSAPAIPLPNTARSVGQDLARQRQPRSGLVLTGASTVSRSNGRRLLAWPGHGSFRGLTTQPQHGIGRLAPLCPERGSPERGRSEESGVAKPRPGWDRDPPLRRKA